jgi:hypothetical protein
MTDILHWLAQLPLGDQLILGIVALGALTVIVEKTPPVRCWHWGEWFWIITTPAILLVCLLLVLT